MNLEERRVALARVNWRSVIGFSKRYLRRGGPEDLVQEAMLRFLDGSREWNPKIALEVFLMGIIRSLASTRAKSQVRIPVQLVDDHDSPLFGSTPPEQGIDEILIREESERRFFEIASEAVVGDPELTDYFRHADAGSRADVSKALGWDPSRVTAARIKLQRRMRRLGVAASSRQA